MSIASLIKKSIGTVVFGLFAACGPLPPDAAGGVTFQYVLLVDDGQGSPVAAINCADAGVTTVKFNIGNDDNANGILDDAENIAQRQQACNQDDADASGILDADEFGVFTSDLDIDAVTFGAISIEFLDAANLNVAWNPALGGAPADVFSFVGDTTIVDQQILVLPFIGDGAQVADELQVFLDGL